ncbi:GNAT family N-acetyltransferase [Bacillus sp. OAE603]|uniref:GNAT family N-acetyltransferase n=1 Tax=Gottfriedia sp. OAE603 TaxID=2663872 RepID=UPI001789C216
MTIRINASSIQIVPWTSSDLHLLYLLNTPNMMKYLGGPESNEHILSRHNLYLELGAQKKGQMFTIMIQPLQLIVGSVGYWEKVWRNETIYEMGWNVLPEYQGNGIATLAVEKAMAILKRNSKHHFLHAFPSIHNFASNAVCRKLHFSLIGQCDFEYPRGRWMKSNNWRYKLK